MHVGHTEEVSTLAVQHSGVMVASASPAFASSPCEIRIWKTGSGKCTKVRSSVYFRGTRGVFASPLAIGFPYL